MRGVTNGMAWHPVSHTGSINESGGQWLGMTSGKSHRCWGVGGELKAGCWGKNSGCSSI